MRHYDSISLSDYSFWKASPADRYAALKELRDQRPVSWQPPLQRADGVRRGAPYWAVVRHADIGAVSRDTDTFVSGLGVQIDDFPVELQRRAMSILAMDAPEHTRLREAVRKPFSPPQIARLEASFARRAHQIVDRLIERGPCDFVEHVSNQLPVWAVSELLGIPEERRDEVFRAANIFAGRADPEYAISDSDALAALETLEAFGRDQIRWRRSDPSDDLVSQLVQTDAGGVPLNDAELLPLIVVLILGGADNIRHTISYAMHALCSFPAQRSLLLADFEKWIRPATDEFIRWGTTTPTMRRTTIKPGKIGDQTIEPGEKVVLFYNSSNRDERVFREPYAFDIGRSPNPHQGLGGGGPHFCLGAHLGKAELRAIFRELLARLPNIQVGEPDYYVGDVLQGIKRMACHF